MSGVPIPDVRAVIEADRERWIARRLLGYLVGKTHDVTRARDLAQAAILLALEGKGWHRWVPDPAKTHRESLLDHLCNLARSKNKDEHKSAAARREVLAVDPDDDDVPEPAHDAWETSRVEMEHQREMQLAERAMAGLDPLSRALLELEQEGVHGAAAQAARCSCTVAEVYGARKRIASRRDAVLAEHRKASEEKGGPK